MLEPCLLQPCFHVAGLCRGPCSSSLRRSNVNGWSPDPMSAGAGRATILFTLLDLCVCHPCAGAMLIFSASFKLLRMIPEGNPYKARYNTRRIQYMAVQCRGGVPVQFSVFQSSLHRSNVDGWSPKGGNPTSACLVDMHIYIYIYIYTYIHICIHI